MSEVEETNRVKVHVGASGISSRYVRVPRGVGEKTFEGWCADPHRWLDDENGRKIRASAVVEFEFMEPS